MVFDFPTDSWPEVYSLNALTPGCFDRILSRSTMTEIPHDEPIAGGNASLQAEAQGIRGIYFSSAKNRLPIEVVNRS
jgi:hypothetical protein